MEKLTRWTVVTLFIFLLITSCAPNRVMTRDNKTNDNDRLYKQDEDYSYQDDNYQKNDDYDEYSNPDGFERHSYTDSGRDRDKSEMTLLDNRSLNRDRGKAIPRGKTRQNTGVNTEKHYQEGLVSWYGREFQDSITASGERFDMYKFTAAHRTLPFGTLIRVKNLENGRSVRVRVNDRGPYTEDRILDLSYAAAKSLDIIKKGEAKVGIEVLEKGEIASREYDSSGDQEENEDYTTSGVSGATLKQGDENDRYLNEYIDKEGDNGEGAYSIQAGAFYSRRNADRIKEKLKGVVDNPVVMVQEGDMYKIRIEGFSSKRDAMRIKKELQEEDISSYVIKTR